MNEPYEYMVVPFVEIEVRFGTLGKTFDSSIDKKYFEKIRDHLETGDWKQVTNTNTIEHCKNNLKLITDKTSYIVMKENVFKEDFQLQKYPFDVRYAVNQEFILKNTDSFDKDDTCVRNKCRKSFISDNFRYDLTIVNEVQNTVTKTKYEIEIELLINNDTVLWNKEYVNDFLECKIYDLFTIVEPITRNEFTLKLIHV
jgi:hypothetical protein